ncbi:hypothetical protein GQ457_15G021140 [Hibiscus cannabinus]
MKEKSESGGGGYVRADQIDLKSLDEQLQRHLSRAWTMEKNKNMKEEGEVGGGVEQLRSSNTVRRQEWEIDSSKLIIKSVIARGTFGTVHRGVYDGQDVAAADFVKIPGIKNGRLLQKTNSDGYCRN